MADPVITQGTDNQTGGNQAVDFVGMLSPENQNHPAAVKFKGKSPDDFFKSYSNLETKIGEKTIEVEKIPEGLVKIPGADASDDDRKAYRKAMNIPEKQEEYQPPDYSDLYEFLPGGKDWKPDELIDGWFRQEAHKAGLTLEQYQSLSKGFTKLQIQHQKQFNENLMRDTKESFGDKYDEGIKSANRALSRIPEEERKFYNEDVGKDIRITRLLYHWGKNLGESQSPDGAGASMGGADSKDVLEKRKDVILNHPDYRNKFKNQNLMKELEEINKKLLLIK